MSDNDSWVALAYVLRPHGLGGALILKPLTRTPDEFIEAPIERVHVRLRGRIIEALTITEMGLHKGLPLVHFAEIPDRTAAEALCGTQLVIREEDRWELEEGQFYHDELVGLEVTDLQSGRLLGKVLRVMDGAAHDFLVLQHPDFPSRELLVPFINGLTIEAVDLEARTVRARLPEGLLEL
jgi:16S rRNA processing protein RimM